MCVWLEDVSFRLENTEFWLVVDSFPEMHLNSDYEMVFLVLTASSVFSSLLVIFPSNIHPTWRLDRLLLDRGSYILVALRNKTSVLQAVISTKQWTLFSPPSLTTEHTRTRIDRSTKQLIVTLTLNSKNVSITDFYITCSKGKFVIFCPTFTCFRNAGSKVKVPSDHLPRH